MVTSRILIVDDEELVRECLGAVLRGAGFEVSMAQNGAEAVRQIGERAPDLVLSDVRMPGLSGIDVCKTLQDAGSGVPVILLSGLGDDQSVTDGFAAGAVDYLVKPWRNGEVVAKVRRCLMTSSRAERVSDLFRMPTVLGHGRFGLGEKLGSGGMGAVFAATDTRRTGRAAVKVLRADLALDPAFVRRFEREAETLARVDHPGVPRMRDVGREGDTLYCAMDLVEGPTLAERTREVPMAPGAVAVMGARLAGVLEALHAVGIVHRDVKPDNVILQPSGQPSLVDFGLARAEDDERFTMEGKVIGTLGFMAPEVLLGGAAGDARADLFALGATLYSAVVGHPPEATDATPERHVGRAMDGRPLDPRTERPGVPDALADVIGQLTQADPKARPQTAAAARVLLEHAAEAMLHTGKQVLARPGLVSAA